ncbi:MAG: precorrin-6Y C5,15-methyltransferase [bacterium]|nr:precorrin-6Y C5,15-methyltransferase [bacterium]
MKAVTIIGIGDDGCAGLTARAANAVAAADVLAGGERHLAFFPQFRGERIVLKDKLGEALDRVAALATEQTVAVLASGDPLFFGIGALVVDKVGAEHVEILPAPSSMQLAFARTGIKWDDATVLSLHGRCREGLLTRLRRLRKVALLTDDESSPRWIGMHLQQHGQLSWRAWVCERLGHPEGERVRRFTVDELAACDDIGALNVVLLQRDDGWRAPPAIPFLHEDDFAKRMPKKGLITKREARCLSLALLQLRADSVVWDLGAGSGSVAIEAAMIACQGRVFAVEVDPEGVELCRDNVRSHAVDNVRVVAGRAPEILGELPDPDAVFIGGSKGSMAEIVDAALARLRPGGRLVANAITLDNVNEAYRALRAGGREPEVVMLNVARAEPLARYMRWEAQNPIHIFAVTK